MEHSVQAYLRRLPTQTLEEFLLDCRSPQMQEDFNWVIDDVVRELSQRNEEEMSNM